MISSIENYLIRFEDVNVFIKHDDKFTKFESGKIIYEYICNGASGM